MSTPLGHHDQSHPCVRSLESWEVLFVRFSRHHLHRHLGSAEYGFSSWQGVLRVTRGRHRTGSEATSKSFAHEGRVGTTSPDHPAAPSSGTTVREPAPKSVFFKPFVPSAYAT